MAESWYNVESEDLGSSTFEHLYFQSFYLCFNFYKYPEYIDIVAHACPSTWEAKVREVT